VNEGGETGPGILSQGRQMKRANLGLGREGLIMRLRKLGLEKHGHRNAGGGGRGKKSMGRNGKKTRRRGGNLRAETS